MNQEKKVLMLVVVLVLIEISEDKVSRWSFMRTFVPSHLLVKILSTPVMKRSSPRCRSKGGQRQCKEGDEMHLEGVCNDAPNRRKEI